MKFTAVTTAFALVLATVAAGKAVGITEKNPQQNTPQEKTGQQASTPQTCATLSKCPCAAGQTQFCGDEAVNSACLNGHLFTCDGSAGNACDQGVDGSCKK